MERIQHYDKSKITLEDIGKLYKIEDYTKLYQKVVELIENNYLKPVKASGLNGKSPALYKRYHKQVQQEDTAHYEEEILYTLHLKLHIDYYKNNLAQYKKDRVYIRQLSNYFESGKLDQLMSINERSFDIWGREKFLAKEGGHTLLKRLGIGVDELNVYDTTIPLAYYTHYKATPQNILIIENKDTFYTLRQHLISGHSTCLGQAFGTLIYGGGKQVVKAMSQYSQFAEPYLLHECNQYYYFGDIDYEGIGIYESLVRTVEGTMTIQLFEAAYAKMIEKSEHSTNPLPQSKVGQNQQVGEQFYDVLPSSLGEKVKQVLAKGDYIPQEIINQTDL